MKRTIATTLIALSLSPIGCAVASADPHLTCDPADAYARETTVCLSQLPDIDSYPTCRLEDGSDVDPARLPCVWTDPDTGDAWLTYEDRSFVVIDDTVRGPGLASGVNAWDAGAYVGGYN